MNIILVAIRFFLSIVIPLDSHVEDKAKSITEADRHSRDILNRLANHLQKAVEYLN
jgi:hypothetical protein